MTVGPLDDGRLARLPRYEDEGHYLAERDERTWDTPDSYGMLHGVDGAYRLLWNRHSHEIYLARYPKGQVIVLAMVTDGSRARELIRRELDALISSGETGRSPSTPVNRWLDSVPDWSFLGLGLDLGSGRPRQHASPRHILYG